MRRAHDSGWPRQRGPGVDYKDQERERAAGRITQLETEGTEGPTGDKKGHIQKDAGH